MYRKPLFLLAFATILVFTSCTNIGVTYVDRDHIQKPFAELPSVEKIETLFLIGDAGSHKNFESKQKYLLELLRKELNDQTKNSSIAFLGDNIYPAGLPKKDDPERTKAEGFLNDQLNLLKDFHGRSYVIPGNHDWNHMNSGGVKAVQRQEKYVQNYFEDKKVKFYPNNACADPVVKKIQKDLYYVFIDSQWWLHDWRKEPKINRGCEIKSRQQFLQEMQHIFLKHKNDQIVVFVHHPFFSNGEHGGHYSLKTNIFPLTSWKSGLFIPLPVIGSIMPLQRTVRGNIQDIPNIHYQELKNEILGMLGQNKNVIFASGHDHNLQYFQKKGQHFVISGSGSKETHIKKGGDALLASSTVGYSKVHFYKNGEVWLEFIKVDEEHPNGELIYRNKIVEPKPGSVPDENNYPNGSELSSTTSFAANENFAASGFKKFWFGKQYRDLWTTPVVVPIIDLDSELGGLEPIKKGGGMASNSLRLRTKNGEHFAMRSVLKDYRKLVDPTLADLKAIEIFTDLNSASHPYGALIIPKLSKAANIYYTKPKLVYLQRQNGLGTYNDLFNEELYLLEDRPAGDRSTSAHLGNSKKIISYLDLLDKQRKSNKIKVDEEWTLRSRLFDLFIHDWDRHDDQWRWASIEDNGEEIYRPIPRDRDQAFYKFEGVVPWLVATFGVRKFKTLKHDLKDVKWQSFNARYFDRYFLHELEWADWEKQITFLQSELTDDVIDQALKDLPAEVYEIGHSELAEKLRSRRDNLTSIAKKLYDHISIAVSIPGSDKKEKFIVNRLENGSVNVKVYGIHDKGESEDLVYERTFIKGETREIRLYGLDGKDQFIVLGKSGSSIKVRIIGGFGKDKVVDNSQVGGFTRKTLFYDDEDGNEVLNSGELKDLSGPFLDENDYNRKGYKYNATSEYPILGFTKDDRFWFGAGFVTTVHGFRKDPYKSQHSYSFSVSPSSRNAFHFNYDGDFTKALFRHLDVHAGIQLDSPFYFNYFGLGNNTTDTSEDINEFNWVRAQRYNGYTYLNRSWVNEKFNLFLGPHFISWSIKNIEGRILDDPLTGISKNELDRKNFLGLDAGFTIESVNNRAYPTEGYKLDLGANVYTNLDHSDQFNTLKAEQTIYLTLGNRPSFTIASRTGWQKAEGDLKFYQHPSIGNNNYLRGFRNDRFRGDEIFYQNLDLRISLFNWNNNILPMKVGLLGGYDIARVWYDGNSPSGFHRSYTAGISMNVLSAIVIQPHVSISDEEELINFRLGFNF